MYYSCHIPYSDLICPYLWITISPHPCSQTLFQCKSKLAMLSQIFSLIQNNSIDTSPLISEN